MRTANFNDVVEGSSFVAQRLFQHPEPGDERFTQGDNRRDMHRGREDIVGTLAFINVIVRMNLALHAAHAAQQFTGAVGQHLVHVHVALRAGTGLPDGQRKFIGMVAGQHFIGGLNNRLGLLCGQ
ncbi:Uncharacterised protein [Raoultella planticola]|uniref:Uncharacterized protein n=1 Tax=Raoultella planticola TaxID=575 RepID=A0A485CXQ0_RAOPL|nr:Uncharacterised protein [Raoultella planticola]